MAAARQSETSGSQANVAAVAVIVVIKNRRLLILCFMAPTVGSKEINALC
jgi:hypothetical protein